MVKIGSKQMAEVFRHLLEVAEDIKIDVDLVQLVEQWLDDILH